MKGPASSRSASFASVKGAKGLEVQALGDAIRKLVPAPKRRTWGRMGGTKDRFGKVSVGSGCIRYKPPADLELKIAPSLVRRSAERAKKCGSPSP